MKIVMVHDCAFVGYELRRELLRRGFDVDHLFFRGPAKIATLRMALKLRRLKCALVHAHFCRSAAYASYASGKPYFVHCHGGDVRWGMNWLQRKCLDKARKVLLSTPDLVDVLPEATWLPNPVDTKRFKPLKEHYGKNVLYIPHWYEDVGEKVNVICKKLGYTVTISKHRSVPYEKMHVFLNQFDIFVDRCQIRSYSKTALEAMACGLPVIGYEQNLEETLLKLASVEERRKYASRQNEEIIPSHRIDSVVDNLINIYDEAIDTVH
jgi:glycosyltransferase involved in cell wall biosynthesis